MIVGPLLVKMDELPYQAEYAKSGRAACKGCKEKIDKGVLRLAVMVQSAFHDGKQPNWHHEECFFKRQRPKTVTDIGRLNTLKHEDQKRIAQAIENYTGIVMPIEKKGKGKAKGSKRAAADPSMAAIKDFMVEYSKSSRATCRICEIKICKDEVRISKTVFDTEIGQKYGGQALWHHVKCFAEDRVNLLYLAGGADLPGFKLLNKEDQAMVKKEIPSMKKDEVPVKKLKKEPKDDDDIKEEAELEKNIEKQNNLFSKYRQALGGLQTEELRELLEVNSQEVPPGRDECIIRIADMMAFGAPQPCEICKQGQLVLETYGYNCTGNVSEWSKCTNVVKEPKRKKMVVPKPIKKLSAFKGYKPCVAVRIFQFAAPPSLLIVKKDEPDSNGIKKERPIPPLKNLQFFLYGRLKNKEETKHRILKLGGLCCGSLQDTLAAVVSTEQEIEKMNDRMMEIQRKEFEVVNESFFDLIDPSSGTVANTIQLIKEHNIADWGSDPAKRIPQDVKDGKSIPRSGSNYATSSDRYASKSGVTKLKLKGGTAVDPDSGLEDVAHVYKDSEGTKWTCVLGRTDVVAKKNSYYKMQILEADDKKKYWVFTSWGRIGTTIGNKSLKDCGSSLSSAQAFFEDKYMDKTENPWEFREDFMKVPGSYYPIDVDYGEDEGSTRALHVDDKCKLAMPVQKLVLQIFDINVMKQTLLEFELDTDKMPLGKLSKKQIKAGYKVLSDLLKHIEKGQANQHKVIDATNSFYTLVPHNFGIQNPPLLDNVELVKKKAEMLDNLLEIEIAYSLLKTDSDSEMSPIESHYLKLKAEIVPLDVRSPEFELLQRYVKNTHAATHSQYTLEIEQVFKVVREGEDRRFKPFRKLHNRRLLWHGSRVTNFAGILSQGLRIAPPEAPVTGYMFGKGIYFADMVSKSANYCCTNKQQPVGVLLLCEVALGDMKECSQAEYVTKLPPGKNSVWGMGLTQPDPAENVLMPDGLIVPCGKPQQRLIKSSLLYNEFIVYDVAQVNVKYLFQLKFNFKY